MGTRLPAARQPMRRNLIIKPEDQNMRILVVTNMYPCEEQPFYGSFVKDQVLELEALGKSIKVVAKSVTHRKGIATIPAYLSLFLRTIYIGLRFKPDIVHTHFIFPTTVGALLLKGLTGVPLVVTSHRGDVFDMPFVNKIIFGLTRFCINRADLLIAVSSEIKSQIRDNLDCKKTPIEVLDMGFRITQDIRPNQSQEKIPNSIIFIGLSFERKGGFDLLEALTALKHVHKLTFSISFIGEFPEKAEQYVKDNRLEDVVSVLGRVSHEDIPATLAKHQIFALPSYSEGLPIAMLEAMSMGLVPIATPVGDIASVIGNEEGILIEPGNISALTDALLRLLTDESFKKSASAKAMLKTKEYTSQIKAKILCDHYDTLI